MYLVHVLGSERMVDREVEIDRWDWRDRTERRRRGIFAIPIPSSTSSLAQPPLLSLLPLVLRDVDVSRVTSPAAECPTTDGRKSDIGSRYAACIGRNTSLDFSQFSLRCQMKKLYEARAFLISRSQILYSLYSCVRQLKHWISLYFK